MTKTLIIGYGNILRGDDALGVRIAEQLTSEIRDESIEIITRHQLTPELAEDISRVERVLFIDAGSQGEPGTCNLCEIDFDSNSQQAFTHSQTPEGLLLSSEILYGTRPKGFLLSIAAASFDYVEGLSHEAQKSLPQAVRLAEEWVEQTKIQRQIYEMTHHPVPFDVLVNQIKPDSSRPSIM